MNRAFDEPCRSSHRRKPQARENAWETGAGKRPVDIKIAFRRPSAATRGKGRNEVLPVSSLTRHELLSRHPQNGHRHRRRERSGRPRPPGSVVSVTRVPPARHPPRVSDGSITPQARVGGVSPCGSDPGPFISRVCKRRRPPRPNAARLLPRISLQSGRKAYRRPRALTWMFSVVEDQPGAAAKRKPHTGGNR